MQTALRMTAVPSVAARSAVRPARALVLPVRALLKTKTAPVKKTSLNGAAPEAPQKLPGLNLGFTADNELFVGRAAMLGFAFSLIGEVITGKGALAQLGYEVFDNKLGIVQIDELVVGLILFNLVCAILPVSGTFVPDDEVESRPIGALQDPRVNLLDPKKFFGISRFGFTKANELFVGRMAQLGFAASLIGETLTGKGALAQFDIETGISLRDTEAGLLVFIAFFLFAAINPGTGKFFYSEEER